MKVMTRLKHVAAVVSCGALLLIADPAAAGKPGVQAPVPVAFSLDCYQQCASPAVVRSSTPRLMVQANGVAQSHITTYFEVRSGRKGHAPLVASGFSSTGVAGSTQFWNVPDGLLAEGPSYFWRARSTDDLGGTSGWSTWQEFQLDRTAPGALTVSSPEYPENVWGPVLGTPASFHFSGGGSGIANYVWWFDGSDPVTGLENPITVTPPGDGVLIFHVYALDVAGNRSATANYRILVTPPPNLFAHWTLDEGSGSEAADSGNLDATATLSGDVAFGPAYLGDNGALFTSASGRIATDSPVLDTTGSFTVMAWVNPADMSADQTLVSQDGFRLFLDAETTGWCFEIGATTTCAGWSAVGEWVHVAAQYDALTGLAHVFVRGDSSFCGGESTSSPATPGTATSPFVIGGGFLGGVDDVRAHRLALSTAEICMHAIS